MLNLVVLHVMIYVNGVWFCPECGRTVQVDPVFKILEKGDLTATHQGSSGGLQMGISVSTATA